MSYCAVVSVMLRRGVSDVQGQTVERALPALGFEGVGSVRVGKRIEMTLEAANDGDARALVASMCERLLANPVIESYEVEIRS